MSGENLSWYRVRDIGKEAEAKARRMLADWLCSDPESARHLGMSEIVKRFCAERD